MEIEQNACPQNSMDEVEMVLNVLGGGDELWSLRQTCPAHCKDGSRCTSDYTYCRLNQKLYLWLIILRYLLFHSLTLFQCSPAPTMSHISLQSPTGISFHMSYVTVFQIPPLPWPTLFQSKRPLPIFQGCPSMLIG